MSSIFPELEKLEKKFRKLRKRAKGTDRLVSVLERIERKLGLIVSALTIPPRPGTISLKVTGENRNMIQFSVQLPALPTEPNDIAKGELTVKVGDGEPTVHEVAKDQTEVTGLEGAQDATVELTFTYIDDAGNRSANPAVFTTTLADTVPPADPGALGVVVTGEVGDSTPSA